MHILIIATHVLSNDIGSGGDILFIELARRWQRQGHHIHLVVAQAGAKAYSAALQPNEVTILPSTWLDDSKRYFEQLLLIAVVYILRAIRTRALVRRLDADVVYTPGDFLCDVVPAAFKKKQQPEITWAAAIFHVNQAPYYRRGNSVLASILSWLAQGASFMFIRRQADIVFPLNSAVQATLLQRGFDTRRLHVMGAGLDPGYFAQLPPRPKKYAACYLGRINPTKGVFDLPRMWAQVARAVPASKLIIIGKGTVAWEKQLQDAIKAAQVENSVEYVGHVPTAVVHTYLQESRVVVSASTEEGFGLSIAEAMACGLPAVAFDLPAYREFFPEGLTRVVIGDVQGFAQAVIRLLTNLHLYETESRAAQAVVQRYDWNQVAARELAAIVAVRSSA